MKKKYLIILFVVFLSSCKNDDCGECFTPPQGFMFEIVDKATGENLFTNETYQPNQIQITNTLNNSVAEFSFISENEINLISLHGIGWETEIVNLKFEVLNDHIFNLYVDAKRKSGNCCSYTQYNNISITESEFELNTQSGIYKILVE